MFVLQGKLINIFETPKGKTKDGESYGGEDKIQVMHETALKNGEKRVDLVDLVVSDLSQYRDKLNSPVSIQVSLSVFQGKLLIRAV
jgi:hypothetical protein